MNIEHLKDKFILNELELQLVKYLEDNQDNLKNITIRQMASANFTSTSAIYRLCNKFGFSGYSDMIYQLSSSTNAQPVLNDDFNQYSQKFIELLNKHRQHNIIVFGMGFSAPIADYIQQRLTLNGFHAMSVIHTEMLDIKYQDNTLLIVISNSGITPRLVEIVDTAFKNNIDIISFIANENSNLYHNATLPIVVGSYNSFTHNNLVPNTFFGQVLIVFESLLYTSLSSTNNILPY